MAPPRSRLILLMGLLACEGARTPAPSPDTAAAKGDEPSDATVEDLAPDASALDSLATCQGPTLPLALAHDLPYVTVGVGGAQGAFLVDWGTTASAIDPSGFTPFFPSPADGTSDRWDGFTFFGPWARVVMTVQDFSAFADPIRQAGILGTDFLSLNVYLVDWEARSLARAEPGQGCSDAALEAAGFAPLPTRGYFARDRATLLPGVPNVPTIPVRVGASEAPAQIDSGFDDALAGPAMNVNRAFFEAIAAADLVRAPELDLALTTCVPGVTEPVVAWRLASGVAVELVAESGQAARRYPDAIVFVKETPEAARRCGGIGTWPTPAAQLGVSFIARARRVVFDPEAGRVWLPASPASP